MRELDEALMDRTTASLSRRQKITQVSDDQIIVREVKDILQANPSAFGLQESADLQSEVRFECTGPCQGAT